MPDALSDAKAALAHANAAFPSKPVAPVAPKASATKQEPTLGDELKAKGEMVGKARQALAAPKMHSGGPVLSDGIYQLKAGELNVSLPSGQITALTPPTAAAIGTAVSGDLLIGTQAAGSSVPVALL